MSVLGTRLLLVVCFARLSFGCSSSSGGSGNSGGLDCAWLAGDNCWKTTATSASSCLPPTTATGVLSADHATCTYESGAVVTFAKPLVLPLPDRPTWSFTIANGGQTCVHYEDTGSGFMLKVGDQVVTEGALGAIGLQIKCPSGASYASSNAFDLLSCGSDAAAFAGDLPGDAYFDSDTSVSLGLVGTSTTSSNELQLFNCAK